MDIYAKRSRQIVEGNGSAQTLTTPQKGDRIVRVNVVNNAGSAQDVTVSVNDLPVYLETVADKNTDALEMDIPLTESDAVKFTAAASVYLTLTIAELRA